ANVARDLIERHAKLPRALVLDDKTASVAAQQAWLVARDARDFRVLAPALRRVVDLKRQMSRCLGGSEPWEAHLREHEPGANASDVVRLVDDLGRALSGTLSSSPSSRTNPLAIAIEDHDAIVAACAGVFGF